VRTPVVVVVAGDMPFAGAAVSTLAGRLNADASVEAVVGRDRSGRRQPLLTAYRRDALRRVLPSPATGVPAMQLLDGLNHVMFDLGDPDAMDIDTPEQLEEARRRFAP
jgi:molybdopterin-guanine dinucleotide biosynthesis protein A